MASMGLRLCLTVAAALSQSPGASSGFHPCKRCGSRSPRSSASRHIPRMMCRTICFRHLGPRVACRGPSVGLVADGARTLREWRLPSSHTNRDAKHRLTPLSLLREHASDRLDIGLRTDAVRCCDVLRVRGHRSASERHRSVGTC